MVATISNFTALVIEDDQLISELLVFLLNREGFKVLEVNDGREAKSTIASLQIHPEIILLDIMLPFSDGFDLLKDIRNKSGWESVPVIMLSAKSQGYDIARAFELGATDYMVKPFQPKELIARIKRVCKNKKSHA